MVIMILMTRSALYLMNIIYQPHVATSTVVPFSGYLVFCCRILPQRPRAVFGAIIAGYRYEHHPPVARPILCGRMLAAKEAWGSM